jgi:hypothetical protein
VKRALLAVDRVLMPETPAERLAMLRLLVGGYAVVFLIARCLYLMSYADFDRTQFEPVGVVTVLPRPLLPFVVRGLVVATMVMSVPFLLGWRYVVTAPIFAGLLLWVLTYANSWIKILHTDNLFVIHVIALALTPAADALSLDARRRRQAGLSPPAPSPRYGWPVTLLAALCIAGYLLAGVAKMANSGGIGFIADDTLRNYIAFDNVRKIELGSIHSPLGALLLPHRWLFTGLAALSLVLELGAPLALVHRRIGLVWVIGVWGFHVGVLALMAIAFPYPLAGVAFAPFFRVEKLLERRPFRRLRTALG